MHSILFTLFCNYHHYFQTFPTSPRETLYPVSNGSPFSPPLHTLANFNLLSISMNLPFPSTWDKNGIIQYPFISGLFHLANIFKVHYAVIEHQIACIKTLFLFGRLYTCATFCLSINLFLGHGLSPHFDCCEYVVNIGIVSEFFFSVLVSIHLGMELLGHMVILH